MNNTIRIIEIHSQEVKSDKNSFIASSAEINGKWYKIKFTKDCERAPKKKGIYKLKIDFDKCSVEKGKVYVNSKGKEGISNDVIWVREIVEIRRLTDEEYAERNRKDLYDVFGYDVDDDIPL